MGDPDKSRRSDFRWVDNQAFRLKCFKKTYSHSKHVFFFSADLGLNTSSKLYQAYSWENALASKEEELLREKIKTLKPGESEERIWKEIINELYFCER